MSPAFFRFVQRLYPVRAGWLVAADPETRLGIGIRPYADADIDVTIDIFLRAIREVSSRHYTPEQIDAWALVDDAQAWGVWRASRPTWIAETAGKPVGFADVTSEGLLNMMFVHPDFQGMGVASTLLAQAEAQAHEQQLDRIHTEASRTARPFFERKGFRVVKAQRVEKRGQMLENFLMEKKLTGR